MSGDRGLLKDQFDVLVHDESVRSDSIENIFDDQFYRRFAELINRLWSAIAKPVIPTGPDANYLSVRITGSQSAGCASR
jgi:hypothetical protein